MLTFEQVKETIEKFDLSQSSFTRDEKLDLNKVASQLGFGLPDPNCKCHDKYKDLIIKLKLWLKNHADGFCHYTMRNGIVRKGSHGQNVYALNLTDEEAEWLIENDEIARKYITKILETNTTTKRKKKKKKGEIVDEQ